MPARHPQKGENPNEPALTIKHMKSLQIFKKVKKHLLTQNQKSAKTYDVEEHTSCFYRYGKLKCAIGALIPDDIYKDSMEENNVECLVDDFGLAFLLPEDMERQKGIDFLRALQNIHDATQVGNWETALNQFKNKYIK